MLRTARLISPCIAPRHRCRSSEPRLITVGYRRGRLWPRGRDRMTLRVAIGGFGAIGKVVARSLDRGIEGLTLAAVAARDGARAESVMAGFMRPGPVVPFARLWEN